MAPGLTPSQRRELQRRINEKKGTPASTSGRLLVGTPDPAKVRGGESKDWRNRNRTGGVVQGAGDRRPGAPPKRKSLAELEAEKQKRIRDKAGEPGKKPTPPAKAPEKPSKGSNAVRGLSSRPDAFGDATKFEDDRRQWAKDHPDNTGAKADTYTPPKDTKAKIIPAPPKKKLPRTGTGSMVVRGMVPR